MAVKEVMKQLGLPVISVELGVVEIDGLISDELHSRLKISLNELGFELIADRNTILIDRIKYAILEMIYHADEISQINFSEYLSDHLQHDYSYLANVFSKTEGTTIEHFVIAHKVERVKELIIYDEINLTEIAYRMNYSSVAHLSAQFKKITGLSPSDFKKLKMIK